MHITMFIDLFLLKIYNRNLLDVFLIYPRMYILYMYICIYVIYVYIPRMSPLKQRHDVYSFINQLSLIRQQTGVDNLA